MKDIDVDPPELRAFASRLRAFAGEVDNHARALSQDLEQLGHSWTDSQFLEFAEVFDRTNERLHRLTAQALGIAPFLDRKADEAEAADSLRL